MTDCLDISIEEHVARVFLNRPEKHNALSIELFTALGEAGTAIRANPDVRVVILSGRGENFCAGIDTSIFQSGGLDSIAANMQPQSPSPANMFQRAAYVWREIPVPVICAIHGAAFGGGMQIALGADIRYAAPAARLSIMEIRWGIIPDMALTTTARGIVALDRLKELAYTGRVVSANEAQALGLVTAVCDDPHAAAENTAAEIADRNPDAIRAMKQLLNEGMVLDEPASLALEARLQSALLGSPNQVEAVQANLQKRTARFRR